MKNIFILFSFLFATTSYAQYQITFKKIKSNIKFYSITWYESSCMGDDVGSPTRILSDSSDSFNKIDIRYSPGSSCPASILASSTKNSLLFDINFKVKINKKYVRNFDFLKNRFGKIFILSSDGKEKEIGDFELQVQLINRPDLVLSNFYINPRGVINLPSQLSFKIGNIGTIGAKDVVLSCRFDPSFELSWHLHLKNDPFFSKIPENPKDLPCHYTNGNFTCKLDDISGATYQAADITIAVLAKKKGKFLIKCNLNTKDPEVSKTNNDAQRNYEVGDIIKGDLDSDGIIGPSDINFMAQALSRIAQYHASRKLDKKNSEEQLFDLNGDGRLTIADFEILIKLCKEKSCAEAIKGGYERITNDTVTTINTPCPTWNKVKNTTWKYENKPSSSKEIIAFFENEFGDRVAVHQKIFTDSISTYLEPVQKCDNSKIYAAYDFTLINNILVSAIVKMTLWKNMPLLIGKKGNIELTDIMKTDFLPSDLD